MLKVVCSVINILSLFQNLNLVRTDIVILEEIVEYTMDRRKICLVTVNNTNSH